MSLLRGQPIKCFTTLQPNPLIFFVEKMREAQKLHTFVEQKNIVLFEILTFEILTTLTNDVVSLEQLGPEHMLSFCNDGNINWKQTQIRLLLKSSSSVLFAKIFNFIVCLKCVTNRCFFPDLTICQINFSQIRKIHVLVYINSYSYHIHHKRNLLLKEICFEQMVPDLASGCTVHHSSLV